MIIIMCSSASPKYGGQKTTSGSQVSSSYHGSRDSIQVIRFACQVLYPLSHLESPSVLDITLENFLLFRLHLFSFLKANLTV